MILWQRKNFLSADITRENDSPNKSNKWNPYSGNNGMKPECVREHPRRAEWRSAIATEDDRNESDLFYPLVSAETPSQRETPVLHTSLFS